MSLSLIWLIDTALGGQFPQTGLSLYRLTQNEVKAESKLGDFTMCVDILHNTCVSAGHLTLKNILELKLGWVECVGRADVQHKMPSEKST